jgi:hypothetical protein
VPADPRLGHLEHLVGFFCAPTVAAMNTVEPRHLGIFAFFEAVPEPRVERTRLHPLQTILVIALLAMICVGEGWEGMDVLTAVDAPWAGFGPRDPGIPTSVNES